jgi:hypothetical protein
MCIYQLYQEAISKLFSVSSNIQLYVSCCCISNKCPDVDVYLPTISRSYIKVVQCLQQHTTLCQLLLYKSQMSWCRCVSTNYIKKLYQSCSVSPATYFFLYLSLAITICIVDLTIDCLFCCSVERRFCLVLNLNEILTFIA